MTYTMLEQASELVTPLGREAVQGKAMGDLQVIPDGAIIWKEDRIVFVGTSQDARD